MNRGLHPSAVHVVVDTASARHRCLSLSGRALALLLALAGALATQAPAQETSEPETEPVRAARLDYSSFRIVSERNIFNANRSRRGQPSPTRTERTRPPKVDSFALVGTLASSTGAYAFFDGSSSEYRKAALPNDTVADFRLTAVHYNAVELESGSNAVQLRVGMQLRREDDGPWLISESTEAPRSAAALDFGPGQNSGGGVSSSGSNRESRGNSASATDVSDVLKRLMERRQQETR